MNSHGELYGYCTGTVRVLYGNCRNMEQRQKREEIEVSTYKYVTTYPRGSRSPIRTTVRELWKYGAEAEKGGNRGIDI